MRLPPLLPSTQVSEWFGAGRTLNMPSRPVDHGWVKYLDDPLTSLAGITPGSTGTWSVNTYVQAQPPATVQMRAMSTTQSPTSPVAQLIECEFEIPASFSSSNGDILGLGWLASDVNGQWCGVIRGDNKVAFLQDAIQWGTTATYTHPAAGTWVRLRVEWNHATSVWKIWVDGALLHSGTNSRTFTVGLKPALYVDSQVAANPTRLRNLKAWYQSLATYSLYPDYQ